MSLPPSGIAFEEQVDGTEFEHEFEHEHEHEHEHESLSSTKAKRQVDGIIFPSGTIFPNSDGRPND